jgi:hypothetical protein
MFLLVHFRSFLRSRVELVAYSIGGYQRSFCLTDRWEAGKSQLSYRESPLIALGEAVIYGHGWTFYLDLDSEWAGAQCEELLRSKGVKVYGRCIANGDAFFQVPKKQAEWAEYLLLKAGVSLKYHLFSERNRKYVGGAGQQQDLLSVNGLLDLLSSLWS